MESPVSTAPARRWLPLALAAIALVVAFVAYRSFFAVTPAPEVTFTDLQGQKFSTQNLRGKVVMVNFWATSCTTCMHEMPQMVQTYQQFKDKGLEFVAVAMSYDPPNYVLNYSQTRQLPFRVALDPQGDLAQSFGDVKLTPTTFVIDKNGNILKRYVGEPDFASLHQLLQKALAS